MGGMESQQLLYISETLAYGNAPIVCAIIPADLIHPLSWLKNTSWHNNCLMLDTQQFILFRDSPWSFI